MKFRVEHDAFAESVAWVARTLPSKPTNGVMRGMVLEAGDGDLTLSGFDYETSSRVTIPAQVSEPGRALVSGRLLSDISRALPHKDVDFTLDGANAKLNCGSSKFTLRLMALDEYPALPEMPTASGTIAAEAFATAVGQVVPAAGREDTLPVLTGVRVEISGAEITLLTTDRYRLALREVAWHPSSPDAEAAALVPARVLNDTAKSLTGSDVIVSLSGDGSGEALIGFEAEVGGSQRQTTTRLLDGEFPKVRQTIPAPDAITCKVRIDAHELSDAVKRVALVAERNAPVRLSFSGADNEVTLDAGSGEEAQASETLTAHVDGDDMRVGFNPTYLLDGLNAIGTPYAHFAFTQPLRPVELTGVADAESDITPEFRYILMPIKLDSLNR